MKRVNSLQRRDLLKTLGAGALVAATGGCTTPTSGGIDHPRPYSRKAWVAPRISADNVIREVVGHRPYRPAGFVVRSEQFDDKTVIHNYGHGGAGITLSWGSSALAVRETKGMQPGDIAVIGSGVMGLTSARLLQDAGWNVTIYTRDMARHTTSNVAGGEWGPFSVYDESVASDAFKSQFTWAARISHHAFTNLGGSDYGIRWLELYYPSDAPTSQSDAEAQLSDLFPYSAHLGPGQHPFPTKHARREVTMLVEPATFLRRITEDFHQAGGQYVIRNFEDKSEILALEESLIVNCTGFGAAALFGDSEMSPAKGQLVYLLPDPAVDYMTIGGGPGVLYMFPRSDAIVLGGTFKLGDYSTEPEPEETARIIREHQRLFSTFT